MPDHLFDAPEHLTPLDLREKLLEAYRDYLLESPPVRSLTVAGEPDEKQRRKNAEAIARKDVARVLVAIRRAGLTPEQLEQLIALYAEVKR